MRTLPDQPVRRMNLYAAFRSERPGLKTIVTWTLTPESGGTRVRMEQAGFRPQDETGYQGIGGEWPRIIAGLERVASEIAQ